MSHSEADHVRSHVKIYVGVFIALCIFTVITVWIAGFHISSVLIAVGLGLLVAVTKGSLVGLYFMHLSSEKRTIYWTLALTAALFFPLLLLPVLSHIGSSRASEHMYAVEPPPPPPSAHGEHGHGTASGEAATHTPAPDAQPAAQPDPEPEPTQPVGPTGATANATIRGIVKFEGQPKERQSLLRMMTRDAACVAAHDQSNPPRAEAQVVGANGGLANAFVYVSKGVADRFQPPSEPAVLDQKGCVYFPHVIGVQVGQAIAVKNSDNTLHNINIQSKGSPLNKGQPANAAPIEAKFRRSEVMVPVKCDVHPWMNAWIGVVEHPYFAVSTEDGSFELPATIRPGTYEITAWHEELGTKRQFVTVEDNGTAELTFTFGK